MDDPNPNLSRDDVKEIVSDTVRKTLVSIGFDTKDPIEFQADARFVRRLRKTQESVGVKALATLVGLMVTGFVSILILGILSFVMSFIHKGGS